MGCSRASGWWIAGRLVGCVRVAAFGGRRCVMVGVCDGGHGRPVWAVGVEGWWVWDVWWWAVCVVAGRPGWGGVWVWAGVFGVWAAGGRRWASGGVWAALFLFSLFQFIFRF